MKNCLFEKPELTRIEMYVSVSIDIAIGDLILRLPFVKLPRCQSSKCKKRFKDWRRSFCSVSTFPTVRLQSYPLKVVWSSQWRGFIRVA
jgi:hypothetical protein